MSIYPKSMSNYSEQNRISVNSKGHSANSVQLYIYIYILATTDSSLQLILSYRKFIENCFSRSEAGVHSPKWPDSCVNGKLSNQNLIQKTHLSSDLNKHIYFLCMWCEQMTIESTCKN